MIAAVNQAKTGPFSGKPFPSFRRPRPLQNAFGKKSLLLFSVIEATMGLPSSGLGSQSPLGRRLRTSGDRSRQTCAGWAVVDTKSWQRRVANCLQRVRNTYQVKPLPGRAAYHWEGLRASLGSRRKAGCVRLAGQHRPTHRNDAVARSRCVSQPSSPTKLPVQTVLPAS